MKTVSPDDVTLVWSFKNRLANLLESITSADKTCGKEVHFCLVDAASNESCIRELRERLPKINRAIRICESLYRTNLCQAWNFGMMLSDTRYVIFSSSDVEFRSGGYVEEILTQFRIGNQYVMLENHAVFGFDKAAIPKMGWFDEEFNHGPHFDCDFMIRASENGVPLHISNNYYYHHADTLEETKDRLTKDCGDRLPMNDFHNEQYFMRKWQSNWPGWKPQIETGQYTGLAHPPTHISQCHRLIGEIDQHPTWTKIMKGLYGD